MIAILRRYESNGRTYRVLDCEHEHSVVEPSGGKAGLATQVLGCQVCSIAKVRPAAKAPIGKCGAVVMNPKLRRTHLCDRDAFELKRGQPRCARHLRKGAA